MRRETFRKIALPCAAILAALVTGGPAIAEERPEFGKFAVYAPGFADDAMLPRIHAGAGTLPGLGNCGGGNVSPAFAWHDVPDGTRSLAVTIVDLDGAAGQGIVHLVAYGIDPSWPLPQGALDAPSDLFVGGLNSHGQPVYFGPCPAASDTPHHYVVDLLALDLERTALPAGLDRAGLLAAIGGHVLAISSVVLRYER